MHCGAQETTQTGNPYGSNDATGGQSSQNLECISGNKRLAKEPPGVLDCLGGWKTSHSGVDTGRGNDSLLMKLRVNGCAKQALLRGVWGDAHPRENLKINISQSDSGTFWHRFYIVQ